MSSLKKNIGLQMSYRMLTIITPLITSPIISRALGADKIGIYSATQAFANILCFLRCLALSIMGKGALLIPIQELRDRNFFGKYILCNLGLHLFQ